MNILFEHPGIKVYVENGYVYIEDDQETVKYDDSPEVRQQCIEAAKDIVAAWERGL
jgi:hypothetical protein